MDHCVVDALEGTDSILLCHTILPPFLLAFLHQFVMRGSRRGHTLSRSTSPGQSTPCLLIEIDHFVEMWVDA